LFLKGGEQTLVKTNQGSMRAAVEEAEVERNKLLEQLKKLDQIRQRISHLDVFIKRGKILLGDHQEQAEETLEQPVNNQTITNLGPRPEQQEKDDDRPLHHKINDIIRESNKSWKVSELVLEFRRRGWNLSEKNGKQVLRNALKLKPELFQKDVDGFYSIKLPTLPLGNKKGSETDLGGAASEP
jgi:hypothetical protein